MLTASQAQRLTKVKKTVPSLIDNWLENGFLADKAVKNACKENSHFTMFKYNEDLYNFLVETYKPKGYKIKVTYTQGFRDGGYPESIKLSWYPKQN